jgi:hypothetical protein
LYTVFVIKAAHILSLFAALSALKLPWFALQIFAWGGMFVNYSQVTDSWEDAIQVTFDRDYRCEICKSLDLILDDSSDEQQLTATSEITLLLPSTKGVSPDQTQAVVRLPVARAEMQNRPQAPPLPPPRPIRL